MNRAYYSSPGRWEIDMPSHHRHRFSHQEVIGGLSRMAGSQLAPTLVELKSP